MSEHQKITAGYTIILNYIGGIENGTGKCKKVFGKGMG